ncbi:hypothetical protein F2P81_001426 [Scophthalmus maximus]|uniref:Uncharacterized protein n=1 Tax=Scophthalmus maximus TaxID=52904 RepID=A0A6A4TE76_SCOMX|nr:hypothetical protein F2P81_001426 [Scophthalmus maximus]
MEEAGIQRPPTSISYTHSPDGPFNDVHSSSVLTTGQTVVSASSAAAKMHCYGKDFEITLYCDIFATFEDVSSIFLHITEQLHVIAQTVRECKNGLEQREREREGELDVEIKAPWHKAHKCSSLLLGSASNKRGEHLSLLTSEGYLLDVRAEVYRFDRRSYGSKAGMNRLKSLMEERRIIFCLTQDQKSYKLTFAGVFCCNVITWRLPPPPLRFWEAFVQMRCCIVPTKA